MKPIPKFLADFANAFSFYGVVLQWKFVAESYTVIFHALKFTLKINIIEHSMESHTQTIIFVIQECMKPLTYHIFYLS